MDKNIIITLVVLISIGIYFILKNVKNTARAQIATLMDNLFIYKVENIYIIRDNFLKDIVAIAKNIGNGKREYIVFIDTEDTDKVSYVVIEKKGKILNRCMVDEKGNLYCSIKNKFESFEGDMLKYNECHGNIKNHAWFHSKTGDTYQINK
jgi:hypothetical protein